MPHSRLTKVAAVLLLGALAAYVCLDLLTDWRTLGTHDWDAMESYRFHVVGTLKEFGQIAWWDPYACGGSPFWAAPEAGTILVSPFLPAYWFLPLSAAIRVEIIGTLFIA